MKIIRVMCTGRVDIAFVVRALRGGADGVFIGGCWPGECHYITEGNYDALANTLLTRKLLEQVGLDPRRLRLEWISASEGSRYAEVVDDFVRELKELGPIGVGEGIGAAELASKLDAVQTLVPYIKLVERERLRAGVKTEEAYRAFYDSETTNRLFDALVGDKLVVGQILSLLADRPLSTGEISQAMQLNPSAVSKHMNRSSRQGLVRYDVDHQQYVLA
jgi:F420-non-reducing hydrogenase iron-sulfur subunit